MPATTKFQDLKTGETFIIIDPRERPELNRSNKPSIHFGTTCAHFLGMDAYFLSAVQKFPFLAPNSYYRSPLQTSRTCFLATL